MILTTFKNLSTLIKAILAKKINFWNKICLRLCFIFKKITSKNFSLMKFGYNFIIFKSILTKDIL
ncbi:hypothetical protein DYF23_05240 [Campylobacter jejuni]|nr:hypothetical protein [Campylobacter jejuni]EAK7188127.1 hypothetical protein [Campylobacter jejuni]EAL8497628.1 hypothetical protein [Campylobacter jejuni]EAL8537554.1 hypothetical protein [Campylobacter jejuni]